MAADTLSSPKVVSHEYWLAARSALFVEDKDITQKLD